MITNLRVRLLQRQLCPCQAKHPGAAALPTDHYAIYDFIVKGSCLCNGHADYCVPARGFQPSQQKTNNMVSDCEHTHLAGAQYPTEEGLFCCENSQRCCVRLKSADGFILSPFLFVLCGEIASRGFPPLLCYSTVRQHVLPNLKVAAKTGY